MSLIDIVESVHFRYSWIYSRALDRTFRVAQHNVPFVVKAPGDVPDVREVDSIGVSTLHDDGGFVFLVAFTDGSQGFFSARVPESPFGCPGDCDNSGSVGISDLFAILFQIGQSSKPACDADASGSVEFNDLVAALFHFGECP